MLNMKGIYVFDYNYTIVTIAVLLNIQEKAFQ